jgi:hypothetical protein
MAGQQGAARDGSVRRSRRNSALHRPFLGDKETTMENRRTETARENDDSDIIDRAEPAPKQGGSSGGNLQEDIATQAELDRVRDPEAREGVDKQDKIDHQQESYPNHPADKSPGGNRLDA